MEATCDETSPCTDAAAWGGAEVVLSPERRVSSGVAALVLILSALLVSGRAGLLTRTPGWMRVFRVGIWVLVVQMALNTLANLASFLAAPRARTQEVSVEAQLEAGVRYLDLRVCAVPGPERFFVHHTFLGAPLERGLFMKRSLGGAVDGF